MPGPGRFPRRSGGPSTIATAAVASRAAESGSARAITSATGRREAPPRCRISLCSVAGTTAPSTRRAIRSIDRRTARSCSGGRTGEPYPRCRSQPPRPPILSRLCGRSTRSGVSGFTRGRRAPVGWGSAWISPGQSTSCIPWPTAPGAQQRLDCFPQPGAPIFLGRISHEWRCRAVNAAASGVDLLVLDRDHLDARLIQTVHRSQRDA